MAIQPMQFDRNALLRFFASVGRLGGKLDIKNEGIATGLGILFVAVAVIVAISILVRIF